MTHRSGCEWVNRLATNGEKYGLPTKREGSCLLWVMSTEISVDIAVDIAVDSQSI